MRLRRLFEDQAARLYRPEVLPWLNQIYTRPDLGQLYLHGSKDQFESFRQPNIEYGHLIFFSKLSEYPDYKVVPLQAEYYGQTLYLVKLNGGKIFDPYQGEPREIMAMALDETVWDRETKIKQGRLDYQDLYRVVPLAIKYSYTVFRVFEVAMGRDSYGVADPSLITVVDRL